MEAPSADALDTLIGQAERRLRPEDGALQVSKTRMLLLLVACSGEQVGGVMRRLMRDDDDSGSTRLRLRTWDAMPPPEQGWAALFADLSPWP